MKTRIFRSASRVALAAALSATAIACGGQSKAPRTAEPSTLAPGESYAPPPSASPPAAAQSDASGVLPQQPPLSAGTPGAASRSMALQSASREIEASQRELDVAAGDCRNACRALGSMDRAAGKVCELSQGEADGRCDDARRRVHSARDRVKNTCGGCPGGPSVERSAPIPSPR